MVKSLVAYTEEIDDVESAVAEILFQLGMDDLLENSVGILSCYSEFIDSGVVEELCKYLPFSVVGTTTLNSAVNCKYGQLALGLMVFTSDDVYFSAAISQPLQNNLERSIQTAYENAAEVLPAKPGLLITFAPLICQYAGDQYVSVLDKVSGGVPNFGTISVDHTADHRESRIIFNGKSTRDCMAVLLLSGNIEPEFYVMAVPENKIRKQTAVITASSGNILEQVNELPLADYLGTLGLATGGEVSKGINSISIIINYNDGTVPVARAMSAITPEGHGICGGIVPVGSTLSVAVMGRDDILKTAGEIVDGLKSINKKDALIMFSCIGRNISLGLDTLAEFDAIEASLDNSVPHFICYSGGEICPVYTKEDCTVNRFHNNSFIACAI